MLSLCLHAVVLGEHFTVDIRTSRPAYAATQWSGWMAFSAPAQSPILLTVNTWPGVSPTATMPMMCQLLATITRRQRHLVSCRWIVCCSADVLKKLVVCVLWHWMASLISQSIKSSICKALLKQSSQRCLLWVGGSVGLRAWYGLFLTNVSALEMRWNMFQI